MSKEDDNPNGPYYPTTVEEAGETSIIDECKRLWESMGPFDPVRSGLYRYFTPASDGILGAWMKEEWEAFQDRLNDMKGEEE